jgi:hypothetical protein
MHDLPPFGLAVLLLPASAIYLTVFACALSVTKSPVAACVLGVVKALLYLLYFGLFFDGTFTFLDDWSYLDGGAELRAEGVNLLTAVDNFPLLLAVGRGDHFIYYLYNAVAFDLFGEGYYAPVALNILTTALTALLATRIAVREQLISRRVRNLFFAFILLHPDILAWSTIYNGKDVLALFLHVLLLNASSRFFAGNKTRALLLGVPAVVALLFLRYYVPVLFAAAWMISAMSQMRGRRRLRVLAVAVVVLGGMLLQLGTEGLSFALDRLKEDFVNPVVGLARFALTPIPFNTETAYGFLDWPAVFHWLMLPAALLGIRQVARMHRPFARFLLAYTVTFVSLYAIYGELQGPRHRIQLDFALALYQFIGARILVRQLPGWRTELPRRLRATGWPLRSAPR